MLNTIEQLAVSSQAADTGPGVEMSARRSPNALVLRRARSPEHPMSEGSPGQYPSSRSREPQVKQGVWGWAVTGGIASQKPDIFLCKGG